MNLLLTIVIFLPVIVALVSGPIALGIYMRKMRFNHWYKGTRYEADERGNYPRFFDPRTGVSYEPAAGNKAFPAPQQNILITNGGQMQKIPTTYRESPRFMVVNPNGQRVQVAGGRAGDQNIIAHHQVDDQPEQLEQAEQVQFLPDQDAHEQEKFNRLIQMRREGRGKIESILDVYGQMSRSSVRFKRCSELWESIKF
jgi:hypothetical protein